MYLSIQYLKLALNPIQMLLPETKKYFNHQMDLRYNTQRGTKLEVFFSMVPIKEMYTKNVSWLARTKLFSGRFAKPNFVDKIDPLFISSAFNSSTVLPSSKFYFHRFSGTNFSRVVIFVQAVFCFVWRSQVVVMTKFSFFFVQSFTSTSRI